MDGITTCAKSAFFASYYYYPGHRPGTGGAV